MTQLFDVRRRLWPRPKIPALLGHRSDLDRYQQTKEKHLLAMAETISRNGRGGVYDQLAGGFHRYSVDERWLVPHSKKCPTTIPNSLKNYSSRFADKFET